MRSTYRQILARGDFDGDGLDDLFLYDDKAGEGRFYKVTQTGLQALGSTITGLSAPPAIVAAEVCGTGGSTRSRKRVEQQPGASVSTDWVRAELSVRRLNGFNQIIRTVRGVPRPPRGRFLTAGNFTSDAGDEILLTIPTTSELRYLSITSAGAFTPSMVNILPEIGRMPRPSSPVSSTPIHSTRSTSTRRIRRRAASTRWRPTAR